MHDSKSENVKLFRQKRFQLRAVDARARESRETFRRLLRLRLDIDFRTQIFFENRPTAILQRIWL